MTAQDVTSPPTIEPGFAARMAFAREADGAEQAHRTTVRRRVTALTVGWLAIVPVLVGYGVTVPQHDSDACSVAASLTILLPFTAAVIATHGRRSALGVAYVVLTLLMVLPAAGMTQLG